MANQTSIDRATHLKWEIAHFNRKKLEAVATRTLAIAAGFTATANKAQQAIDDLVHDIPMLEAELATLQ